MKAYKNKNYEQSLIETFLKFDDILRTDKVNGLLKKFQNNQLSQNYEFDMKISFNYLKDEYLLTDLKNESLTINKNNDTLILDKSGSKIIFVFCFMIFVINFLPLIFVIFIIDFLKYHFKLVFIFKFNLLF